jgi:hypothetical protein
MLRALHARGFRQFLFEWTQAANWLMADYAGDGGPELGWVPPASIGGHMITAIRDLNRSLPVAERIRAHATDVTWRDCGGAQSFLASLASDYGSAGDQTGLLERLQDELVAGRTGPVASWGQSGYDTVLEVVEVELGRAAAPARHLQQLSTQPRRGDKRVGSSERLSNPQ